MKAIKMTKTKLYQLTEKYSIYPLPILKKTEVRHYKDTYWLEFYSKRKDDASEVEKLVKVIWGRFCGENFLNIQCKSDDYDKVFLPDRFRIGRVVEFTKNKKKGVKQEQ